MLDAEQTCGQELAESAVVPEQIAQLLVHVAANLRAHAGWVGTHSVEAAAEHAALLAVADGYEGISAEAQRVCNLMRTHAGLAPAPHATERMDQAALVSWMEKKITLQRRLADLLYEQAQASEFVLQQMSQRVPPR
jgi:hypothetical protein